MDEEKDFFESEESKTTRTFGRADYILAFILLAASWFYIRGAGLFPGSYLVWFTVLFAGAGLFYLMAEGRKMTKEGKCYLLFMAAAAGWFLVKFIPGLELWERQPIMPYMVLFLHGIGVYWLLTISGARIRGILDESGIYDLARGFFAVPLMNFGSLFGLLGGGVKHFRNQDPDKKKCSMAKAGQIAFGIILSIPVLVIVLPMLAAADESFSSFAGVVSEWCGSMLGDFFGLFSFGEILLNLMVFLGACYFYALFYGSFHVKVTKTEDTKEIEILIPSPVLISLAAAVEGVYLLFFLVKFADIAQKTVSGLGQFVYSTYARQGFFELVFIAVINFCLFYFIKFFSEKSSRLISASLRVLCMETLGFIVLAFSKMSLYISVYGFTFKRVFTIWFMTVLFFTFSRLFIYIRKTGNAIGPAVIFASVTFLILAYSHMDFWMNQANLLMNLKG